MNFTVQQLVNIGKQAYRLPVGRSLLRQEMKLYGDKTNAYFQKKLIL